LVRSWKYLQALITVLNETETIDQILNLHTIAVVGLSPKPERPSHDVARYMQKMGYKIIPVNPGHNEILGKTCYPSLDKIPGRVDTVVVFRRPEFVMPVAEMAIAINAKSLWLQDGVIHSEAARKAEEAGLLVVMDDCIKRRHQRRKYST
jgi:predicted CoA-binding protein